MQNCKTYVTTEGDSVHFIGGVKHDPFGLNPELDSAENPFQLAALGWSLLVRPLRRWEEDVRDPCDVRHRKD